MHACFHNIRLKIIALPFVFTEYFLIISGCKIKALRAKTNTYIKTPVRGEEPVFVVTGRKEDVAQAKREILSAAEHFSQIRATRKGSANGGPGCPPAPVPGQITIQVRVPYRVVGLVVGPKGATIKRIQQQTHTYIVTPSRDKDPVFEVTGLPDNVQMSKREIEAHIAIRTGSLNMDNQNPAADEFSNPAEILASLYKSGLNGLEGLGLGLGAINSLSNSLSNMSGLNALTNGVNANNNGNGGSVGSSSSGGGSLSSLSSMNGFNGTNGSAAMHGNPMNPYGQNGLTDLGFSLMENATQNGLISSSRSEDSYLFGGSGPNSIGGSQTKLADLFGAQNATNSASVSSSLWGSFDRDEGLGDSPTMESAPGSNMWPELQKLRVNQNGSPPGLNNGAEQHGQTRRMSSEPILGLLPSVASSTGSGSISGPSSPTQLVD